MVRYWIILLFFILPGWAFAQVEQCGTDLKYLEDTDQAAARAFYQKDRTLNYLRSNSLDSVAVTIHVITTSSTGDVGLSFEEIERELKGANRVFGTSGVEFFICGSPRIIQGASTYDITSAEELNRKHYVPNTINIYFVDDVYLSNGDPLCGFARFPFYGFPERRFIFMDKDCSTNGSTLIHELGHFYGLFHTHETAFGLEYVDGSNCDATGDLICDTAADPNLSRPNLLNSCNYVGNIVDPNGDPYAPPVANFMSYAPPFCQQEFSLEQRAFMRAVHEDENNYLTGRCDFYPDFALNSSLQNQTISSASVISAAYQIQSLAVEATTEIDFRIILYDDEELTRGTLLYEEDLVLFPGQTQKSISLDLHIPPSKVSGTYYLVAELDSRQNVIERTEKNNKFSIEVAIDNSQFQDLVLFPNPAQTEVFLFLRDRLSRGDYTVRVFRHDGVEVLEERGYKSSEELLRPINVSALPTGFYIAFLDFEKLDFRHSFKFFKTE